MKILVTGGTGTLGSILIDSLLEKSHQVVALSKNPDKILPRHGLSIVYWEKENELPILPPGIQRIYHFGGAVSGAKHNQFFPANVISTKTLWEYAAKKNIEHMVYASSASVYGFGTGFRETDSLAGKSTYAISKIEAENFLSKTTVPTTVLRLASIYGKNSKSFLFKILKYYKKRILLLNDSRDTEKTFLHTKDFLRFMNLLTASPKPGIFNLGEDKPISFWELKKYLVESWKKNYLFLPNFVQTKIASISKSNSFVVEKLNAEFGFHCEHSPIHMHPEEWS